MKKSARGSFSPLPGSSPAPGGITSLCKDAFNRVIAINGVNEIIDATGENLGIMVRPGIFTNAEISEMKSLYTDFAGGMKDIIEEKFKDAGNVLDDCLKRETRAQRGIYK